MRLKTGVLVTTRVHARTMVWVRKGSQLGIGYELLLGSGLGKGLS